MKMLNEEIFYSKKVIGGPTINNYNVDLTEGKIYTVINNTKIVNPRSFEISYYIFVKNDNNIEVRYDVKFFISLSEFRDNQLEKFFNESR